MSKVLVTGGHGFIGSHLVEQLIWQGYQVRCLVRPTSNLRWVRNLNVELVTGDLHSPNTLLEAVKGQEMIFHCAAVLKGKNSSDFDQTNLEGTVNLLEATKVVNPDVERVVILSSIAATGPSPSKRKILSEEDPCNPVSHYGRSKLKMEEFINERYHKDLPLTVIRPPFVFGPRDDKVLPLFFMTKWGIQIEDNPERAMNLVYVKDLVKGILAAGVSPLAEGETYFILDPHAYSWREILKNVAKILNRRPLRIHLPQPIFSTLVRGSELLASLKKKEAFFNREKLQDLSHPFWLYSSAKARRDFHFETYTPLNKALKETAKWYKDNKWL
ncbi:MAG TPA: NAD-dependent epimerase/dehydratase family protein [Bdellovibrionota bacterium]|nr:NAD-dependent epimerase/dehydratase family protein [Bdellovibrionota bacterium]